MSLIDDLLAPHSLSKLEKWAFGFCAVWLLLILGLAYFSTDSSDEPVFVIGVTDRDTGLPVAALVFHPVELPDGHYTIAVVGTWTAKVVRHQGPYRDFVYSIEYRWPKTLPLPPQVGDRFTVFQRKVIRS